MFPHHALQVRRELRSARLFVDCDVTDRKMQKKVREAQLAQYNYILVVGEQEKVGRGTGARVQPTRHDITIATAPHYYRF